MSLDVHLMIENPDINISDFALAGADIISVLAETCPHLHLTDEVDIALIMKVKPGFGGQSFIENMIPKIDQLVKLIDECRLLVEIEVDGGINLQTFQACVEAGANVLVAGSAIYNADNRISAIE